MGTMPTHQSSPTHMDDHLCRDHRAGGLRQLLAGAGDREVPAMLGVANSLECVPRHRDRSGGRLGTGLIGPGGEADEGRRYPDGIWASCGYSCRREGHGVNPSQ